MALVTLTSPKPAAQTGQKLVSYEFPVIPPNVKSGTLVVTAMEIYFSPVEGSVHKDIMCIQGRALQSRQPYMLTVGTKSCSSFPFGLGDKSVRGETWGK